MIDIEYAEYGLLPQLLLANRPQGITLCQVLFMAAVLSNLISDQYGNSRWFFKPKVRIL